MFRAYSIRFVPILFTLTLLVTFAPIARASPSALPPWQGVLTNCSGEYFNNTTITGSPVLTRTDPTINFFWPENASPAPGITTNNYSVRWTCTINVATAGNVTFNITTDDGMNVLVDGNLILWAFYDQGPTAYSATTYLNVGAHTVRVEYYNRWNAGTAIVSSTASPGPFPGPITPIPPSPSGVWYGQYFNNIALSGSPVYVRNDPAINFNWGETMLPAPYVPHDNFSVRWTSTQNLPATADYTITATSDDGVRVWVDGAVVIDGWSDHPPVAYTATRTLAAGAHAFQVEYYNRYLGAMVVVQITSGVTPGPGPSPTGAWRGYYFNNIGFYGSPAFVRDDPAINFNWGEGGIPAPGVPHNNFSVRWDSVQNIPVTGDYTISATSDDGVRVWVDGSPAVDGFFDHPSATFTTIRNLTAGAHSFSVEYYNRYLGAMVVVQIYQGTTPPFPPNPPVPPGYEVIVDDGGAGWQAGGTQPWQQAAVGVGNHSFWSYNVSYVASGYNWARWYPTLAAPGYYEVFAYIPGGIATTLNARYWIYHSGRYDLAARAQGLIANQWGSLGTYYFSTQPGEFVSLSSVTYECYLCRTLVFDAIKFSPR